jgi:hypothetical protein
VPLDARSSLGLWGTAVVAGRAAAWSWRPGLQAPFASVHIVLLERLMGLGASVAFVSEPATPGDAPPAARPGPALPGPR